MRFLQHKSSIAKRGLSVLCILALCLGLMPTAAFAAGTDTGKAIQFVDSGTAANIGGGQADNIYFGTYQQSSDGSGGYNTDPIKWRVLENADGQLFLLSDQNLDVFQYHTDYESVTWETSTMRSWLNGYDASHNTGGSSGIDYTGDNFINTAFSEKEQGAIADTTVVNDDNPDYNTEGGNDTTDQIFLLSIAEAQNSSYFADNSSRIATNTAYVAGGGKIGGNVYGVGEADYWWLRSPGTSDNFAASVPNRGSVSSYGAYVDDARHAVRPAFHLDLKSVLFTSAAVGGKIPAAGSEESGTPESGDTQGGDTQGGEDADGGNTQGGEDADGGGNQSGEDADAIFEIGAYTGNEWKLTLLDSSRNFSVTEDNASGNPGDTITLNYAGATKGANEYISVLLTDQQDNALYYGRVAQPQEENGTVEVAIPTDLALGKYTLNVFNEQYNGDYKTDYASAFATVDLTVEDTIAPALSGGTATRTSETTATVKFTSSEAGEYFYEVVESGATAPTINTTVTGTACVSGENTISIDNLSDKSAKELYIVAKDAMGNVSQPLKIEIPAIYTLTVNLNGGSGSTTSGEYTAGRVVSINAGSKAGYRFAGWTASGGGTFADASSASTTFTMPASDVTVTAQFEKAVTGVSLDKTTLYLYTGESATLTAAVAPSDAANQNVIWQSNNANVATVEGGVVTAVGAGTATITVTTEDGNKTATCQVTVKSRPSYNPPTVSEKTIDAIQDAQPGETVTVDLSRGSTKLDKEVFEELRGQDITLVIELGDGLSWTINGSDIPENAKLADIDLGVTMNSHGIPVDIINAITGEHGSVQVELAHNGAFGFTMTLTAPLGAENAGLWANLYHFNEEAGEMTFETAAQIGSDGNVALAFSHASQYAIVIDDHNHGVVTLPFTDVSEGDWFYDPVCFVFENGLMTGTSATTFEPNTHLSRAMLVAVLHRLEGSPTASAGDFTDVADGDWYAQAVNWAASVGVVNGFDDGTFQPNTAITREQMAAILRNYAQYKGLDVSASGDLSAYTDADSVSDWAKESMQWAVGEGLLSGMTVDTLEPQGLSTRAQVAAVLQRYLDSVTE